MDNLSVKIKFNNEKIQYLDCKCCHRFLPISKFNLSGKNFMERCDGNGRVGRLIMFKECLKYNIPPFIIEDKSQEYYKRGLREYLTEKGFLIETCRAAQDVYKKLLEYFEYI